MVRLHVSHAQYLNDIADEVRLFAGREEIVPADAGACDISVVLEEEGGLGAQPLRRSLKASAPPIPMSGPLRRAMRLKSSAWKSAP